MFKKILIIILTLILLILNSSFYIKPQPIQNIKQKDFEPNIISISTPTDVIVLEENNNIKSIEQNIFTTEEKYILTDEDKKNIEYIAKTLYGEYRGESKEQQAAVVWCILNRVGEVGFAEDIIGVITQPSQFFGYNTDNPILDYLWDISEDVYKRWIVEQSSEEYIDVGRILPKEYKWFSGNGEINIFRDSYIGGNEWDWSLKSPY